MKDSRLGIVGAGVMGAGVAQDLAQHGYRPILIDVTEVLLDRARRAIRQGLRAQALLGTADQRQSPASVLERITFTTDYDLLQDADFVVENAFEGIEAKRPVYQKLSKVCQKGCIVIANTSCIPIARLGAFFGRPELVIGVHFMNPVPMKRSVEMIPGPHTSAATIERTKALMADLNKTCIMVNDSPGFVSNRVLMLTINEAIFLLQEQVADASTVDEVFRSCFGHKMGPLETADLIGLDTILNSLLVLLECFGDPKFRPCPLLSEMVDAGRLGRKSGAGFHEYT